jgi:hypothetical protein
MEACWLVANGDLSERAPSDREASLGTLRFGLTAPTGFFENPDSRLPLRGTVLTRELLLVRTNR